MKIWKIENGKAPKGSDTYQALAKELGKSEKVSPSKPAKDDGYRYHVTGKSNLAGIGRYGLKPGDGVYGRGVYFTDKAGISTANASNA